MFYAVDVPAGELMTARLSADFDGSTLVVVTDCSAASSSCLVAGSSEVSFANHSAVTQLVFVAVDGALGERTSLSNPGVLVPADQGAYTLTTTSRSLAAVASTEVCETASTLTPGTTVQGTTVGHPATANGFGGGACGFGATPRTGQGRDAYYRVTVPSGRTLRAAVGGAVGQGDVVVGIVSDCTATRSSCLADADTGSGLVGETAVFTNATGAAREVFVVVDAISPNNGFTFNLTATLE